MAYNKRKKLQDNIEAIKVVLSKTQGAPLSDQERETLRKYSGFGGLKFILNPAKVDGDKQYWKKSDQKYFDLTRQLYDTIRDLSANEQEEQELVSSVKRSVNTAFYTPQPLINGIARTMQEAGVELHTMLDPSAGIGKFGDAFKGDNPDVKVTAYEKDLLTGRILQALNPQDDVHIDGFENVPKQYQGTFDLATSNIPFGDIRVYDMEYQDSGNAVRRGATNAIHNYFFLKSLDMVREGGFVAFITSRGFMDSPSNNDLRTEIIKNARLVGAFRLPEGMFLDEAGTEVGSDLVVLQKYTGYDASLDPDSLAFCDVEKGFQSMGGDDYTDISLNSHWWKSMIAPDSEAIVATKWEKGTDPYGKPTLVFTHDGGIEGITKQLTEYLKRDLYHVYVDYYKANAPEEKEDKIKEPAQAQSQAAIEQVKPVQQQAVQAEPTARVKAQLKAQNAPVQLDLFSMWESQDTGMPNPLQPASDVAAKPKWSPEPRPYEGEMKPHYRDGIVIEDAESNQIGVLSKSDTYPIHTVFSPLSLNADQSGRMRQYVKVRDAYEGLYTTEAETRQAQPELRETLNRHYDDFVKRYGRLNERKNAKVIMMDALGRDALTLENAEGKTFTKADIFARPVSFIAEEVTHADSAEDALFASLNRFGVVNLEYMVGLTGRTQEELTDQLSGRIYYNPLMDAGVSRPNIEDLRADAYDTAEHLLSGNVYEKLERAQEFLENMQEYLPDSPLTACMQETVNALEKSLPQQIAFDDIGLQFGERWIPTSYYEEYISKLFDSPMEIHYVDTIDEYSAKAKDRYNLKIREEYCVRGEYKDYDGIALLAHAFHDTTPDIQKCVGYDENGDDVKGPDMEKIQLAASKIQEIRDGFTDYLTNLPREKREELQQMYNRKFNCFVKAKYDGSHQTFPGIDMKALGSSRFNIKDIYKSQKDCVWMLLQNGGGICDHEVGTGKTLIMCMTAHEMHRLGLANKPMIIALKANVAEIAATYQAAFPDDKILYASEKDFSPANRVQFFNRIKNNDYACVIMSHDQFGKIPQSMEIQRQILSDEMRDIEEALDVLRREGGNVTGRMLTGLEKRKEGLGVKIQKISHDMAQRKDDFVDFDMMGIDHILIDESHQFKNLTFATRHQRVSGLGNPAGSQKALNLLYAIRTIQQRTGRDLGATFLSGTTISNSLTELYLLFKYLRPQAMQQQGIRSFDAWAAVYAKKTSDYEFNVTNQVQLKERFRYFVKVPELATFYNEITDYRTGEDVGLDRPDMNVILHNIQPTADQRDFNQRLVEFAQTGDGELIFRPPLDDREKKGKMLLATDASRKASLDMRLISQELFDDDPDNKASHCARLVAEYYQKYNEQKGTQFVFSDLSTYKPGEWNVFAEIKRKLVEDYNIPESEIRFIQEAKNQKQRNEIIKGANDGTIRVLFGSTSTLGTGVNAQKRAVAAHHIDIPWRPSDLEQRNGRARRTGNEVAKLYADNNVDIIIYAVERSLDSYKFNLLQNKQLFITQLKTNQLGSRVIDEGAMDEDSGMNFAEYVAILSGNDDLLQKAKIEKKIMGLESERKSYMQARRETEWRLESAKEKVTKNEAIIQNMTEDYEKFQRLAKRGEDGQVLPGLTMPKVDEFTPDGAYNVEGMGDALQDAGRTIGNKDRQMGEVYGFPLIVDTLYMHDEKSHQMVYAGNKFYLKGHYQYEYNNGKLAMSKDNRLGAVCYGVNALEKIPGYIQQYKERNEKLHQDIAEYERIAGKPWGKEEELKALKHDMEKLDKQIQAGLDAASKLQPQPKVEPYKFSKEGRYHTVTFARDAYPLVSIKEMREMADTGSWRNRGFIRCGHWDGDMMVSDPEVVAEFSLRQKAEEFIQAVVSKNKERIENEEYVRAVSMGDTKGETVNQDNEVIFAARKLVDEMDMMKAELAQKEGDTIEDAEVIEEIKDDHAQSQQTKPLVVYSLGQYGVGENGEELREIALQLKKGASEDTINDAVDKLATIFNLVSPEERERMVLVPMPDRKGLPGYMDDVTYELGAQLSMESNNRLTSTPHPSLYALKKEQGNDNLPEIDFNYDGQLPKGTIVVLVDNVLDTGHTMTQALKANFGEGVDVRAAVLANTDIYQQYHPEIEVKDVKVLYEESKARMAQATELVRDVINRANKLRPAAHVKLPDHHEVEQEMDKDMSSSHTVAISNTELRDALIGLLRESGISVNTKAEEGDRVLAQFEGQVSESRGHGIFVSNAQLAVERIHQEKGTPQQWLSMIERLGGIKAGEDHWTGLSTWLRDCQERTLTKEQVLDYIGENQIQVEEVRYEAPDAAVSSPKLDMLNEEFAVLMDEAEGETGSIYVDDYARWAFDRLTERYGTEFTVNTQYERDDIHGWHLKPFEHYEGEGPTNQSAAYYGLPKTIRATRLDYTTDGLENKREIALVVPSIRGWREGDTLHFGDAGAGRAIAWVRFGDTINVEHEDITYCVDGFTLPQKDATGFDIYHPIGNHPFDDGTYVVHRPYEFLGQAPVMAYVVYMNDQVIFTLPTLDDAKRAMNSYYSKYPESKTQSEHVLVIDEIQSKRHQEGRAHGYISSDFQQRLDELAGRVEEAAKERNEYHVALRKKYGQSLPENFSFPDVRKLNAALERIVNQDERQRYVTLANRVKDRETFLKLFRSQHSVDALAVPAAPFEKNWHELAIKRILRYAADNGYDRVAWTTGAQQAERYNLGKVVDAIDVNPYKGKNPKESDGFDVTIITSNRDNVELFVTKEGKISSSEHPEWHDKPLAALVGDLLAKKILSGDGGIYTGDDLRIGIDGMTAFYDKIIPNFVNKYGKQWGAHTEDVNLSRLEYNGVVMHSVPITEQMKESVQQGQPMFFKDKNGTVYGFVHEDTIYIDPRIATAETPIHEYTHLWAAALRDNNREEWKNIVRMMKDTPEVWNDVERQYPNLKTDDEIASEALAQFSGQRGSKQLQKFAEGQSDPKGIFEKVTAALGKFWNAVSDFLHLHYNNKEEVSDRVLHDMLSGVNPLKYKLTEEQKIQGLENYDREDIEEMVEDYVNEKLGETYPGEDVYVKEVTIIGSRTRNEARPDSDLDILLEYGGKDVREDALFNVLNENHLEIEGIPVDINPINEHYSLNTKAWLERDAQWREADRTLSNMHQTVMKGYDDAGLADTPLFLSRPAEYVYPDTRKVETYTTFAVNTPYIMLYAGMDDAQKHLSPMMLTDFTKDVQRQVLVELSKNLKDTQEKARVEHIRNLAEELNLDYMPLTLRTPVVAEVLNDDLESEKKIFSHVMISIDDIEVYDNRDDAYDCRRGTELRLLPNESQSKVYDLLEELLTQDDRQLCLFVDKRDVPDYALPAIINGDYTGLSDEDIRNIKDFLDKYPDHILSPREVSPFFSTHPAFGQDTDCVPVDIVRLVTPRQLREERRVSELSSEMIKVQEQKEVHHEQELQKQQKKLEAEQKTKEEQQRKTDEAKKAEAEKKEKQREAARFAQVLSFKQKYPDAIILMRGGDFYNMYGEDAEKCARTLGIALSECKYEGKLQQTASFPHHSLDVYLPKLVRAGYRIAICDQLEEVQKTNEQAPTSPEAKEEPAKEVALEAKTSGPKMEKVSMTRDDDGRYVLYVKPMDEPSFAVYPETDDIKQFFEHFRSESFDSVREQLGRKYYAMVQRMPDLKTDALMPRTGEVDLSRISKVNITKDRFKENTTILFATIDGVQQKPVELTKLQTEHFWLSDDKNQFKTALAAQLFHEKLCPKEEQHRSIHL